MRPFHIDDGMRTMRGVFYPTGWMVLMFDGEQHAREAVRTLEQAGFGGDAMMLMSPQDVKRELAGTEGDDAILPSAGTEGDTVRKIVECASKGHHGLMVHAPHSEDSDRVVEVLKGAPISYGQKYRKLVIEDIVA